MTQYVRKKLESARQCTRVRPWKYCSPPTGALEFVHGRTKVPPESTRILSGGILMPSLAALSASKVVEVKGGQSGSL